MKTIPLTRGKVAIVDDEDFDLLSKFKWQAVKSARTWYATGGHWDPSTKRVVGTSMHRMLMGNPKYSPRGQTLSVDHINGDGLDNRKSNLRLADRTQQSLNRPIRADNKSGYKGVYKFRTSTNKWKWRALIKAEGRRISLGLYETAKEAGEAYNRAAERYYGEYRRI